MATPNKVFEFRGIDSVYYAKVLSDTKDAISFDEPKYLAPVAELGKTTEASSEAHYYDNKALISLSSEGADELTLSLSAIPIDVLADITGKYFDESLGMMAENSGIAPDIALLYRTKGTDGEYRYVTRYKMKASIPEETVGTENDGTDANGQELTLTGVSTVYEFTKGGSAKAVVVDTRYGLADVESWFTEVHTIDSVTAKA
jgi:phi13 family phage major tail protein